MEYHLIKEDKELEVLKEEWNALLDESISNVPFLRHEYISSWWQTRGGGEWENAQLATVTAWREGTLVGIAPLFLAVYPEEKHALMLLGSLEISDYLDMIVRERDLPEFVSGLLDFLVGNAGIKWDSLEWFNVPEASPSLAILQNEALQRGWGSNLEPFRPTVSVPLTSDFETYLGGIDKKQRHEIRRKMRRAIEHESPVHWYTLEDGDKLEGEMEDFLALMAHDPEKAFFLNPVMREQMKNAARAAWQNGWLQLAFLEVDGRKAAGYMNFDYLERIWVYNSGLDRSFLELSPGWVLLGHLLQWANENKRSEFDFMRGDEDYKFKFGGVQRYVMHLQVTR